SSRRRHTRWPRDWSSDVCSSDLSELSWRVLRQRDTLPVVVKHVFHLHRSRADVDDLVTAIDNIAFHRNKDVVALRQESLARFSRLVCEAEELEIDGWWRRRWRRNWRTDRREIFRLNC